MLKKIILTVIIIILLSVVAFLSYHFFFVKSQNPEATLRDSLPFGPSPDPINGTTLTDPGNGLDPSDPDFPNGAPPTDDPTFTGNGEIPILREISREPVSGAVSFGSGNTLIRFIKRENGEIFETGTETLQTRKIAESGVSPVYRAHWQNGNTLIARTLSNNLERVESREIILSEDDQAPFFFGEDLQVGDRGEAVRELQRQLNRDPDTELASSGPGSFGSETTFFSSLTENAVKRLQEKYSEEILEPQGLNEGTGVVDSLTREKLNELSGWKEWSQRDEIMLSVSQRVLEAGLPGIPRIKEITISPERNRFFLLKENESGAEGFIRNPQTREEVKVFQSPLREWQVHWPSSNRVALTTKPSNGVAGYLYLLNINTGNLEKVLGGVSGLTALVNSNSSKVLYSEINSNNWDSKVYNLETGEILNFSGLNILPEKCVWSRINPEIVYCAVASSIQGGSYPDSWYQGQEFLTGSLWKINTETGKTESVNSLNPPERGRLDAFGLFLSPDENYLFFTNKRDLSFWNVRL